METSLSAMMAGLVLVYKRLGGILQLLWQMLVFFTGALVTLPGAFFGVISHMLPLTWGIIALRSTMIGGVGLSDLWHDGTLTELLVNTPLYVLLGAILFAWGSRKARELGVLGHY